MATAAVLGELRKRRFEAVEILYRHTCSLGVVAELDEPGLKVRMSSQIFGEAVVSPPIFELSGKRPGILAAASSKVANAFLAVGRSKGASPLIIFAKAPAACPLDFIIAFLAAIGSCWLETAVVPKAKMTNRRKGGNNFHSVLPSSFPVSRKHPVESLIPELKLPCGAPPDHEFVISESSIKLGISGRY